MKLSSLSDQFIAKLADLYPEDEAIALFFVAIAHYLKLNRSAYLLKKEMEVVDSDLQKINGLLSALQEGKPIQYVIGETEFFGLPFRVNPSVLIPRPETEELVEWILAEVKQSEELRYKNAFHILDIGTGSGCIAISLKKNLPEAIVSGLDISAESLATAKENASLNQVEVAFMERDILDDAHAEPEIMYSVIVSNPPYITLQEKQEMHQNVLKHEPHRALFVSNEEPLIFYEAIADFALKNLIPGGLLFFEINEYLAKETIDLLNRKSFNNITLRKDMQGKDRMVRAVFSL
jgi:release factor glutamine methyltransferase